MNIKVLLYKKGLIDPETVETDATMFNELVGGAPRMKELVGGLCFKWSDSPREKSVRNVFLPVYNNSRVEVVPMRVESNYLICGFCDGVYCDYPEDMKGELKSIFGF